MTSRTPEETFIAEWNAIDRSDRKYLRRLVRMGRPVDDPHLAQMAPSYARYQRARIWSRLFWVWFVPGVLLALTMAARIHPLFVGIVLAVGAQAAFANYNLRRAARLEPSPV